MSYKEPLIPPPGVKEQEPTEVTKDTKLPSTEDIQPPRKRLNFFNDDSIPLGVKDSSFNMEEDILFLESLLIEDPFPPHPIIPNQTKFPIEESKHSFNMGYEHFNTNLVTNDVVESSTKNLVPIPRECEVVSNNRSESIEPVKDESSVFTTISNPLFDNDKINSDDLNLHVESNSDESTSNHVTVKFDNLDEFPGPLIPIQIVEEERIRREHVDYINRMEIKTMRVEESLNMKFDESPPPETPPLEDDDVLENENMEKQEKDLEIKKNEPLNKEIPNIKESKDHPLETVIEDKIFFNQSKYVKEMLKKFGLENSKPIKTLMASKTKLTRDEDGEPIDDTKYHGMIGSLLYLMASRPDIMFSVCLYARFQDAPSHLEAVKRIFRYIKGTSHLGLWYHKGTRVETIVYSDSDHEGDYVDRKSTSGVCTFMGCCPTSWFFKKQTALAIPTTEAKYVLAEKACQQALWMKQALVDYDINLDNIPVLCDNKGVIDLSKNPVLHSRTKHIEIRHHFLRDNVQKGNISIEKVSSEDNIANILTKPLKREPINLLRLGLRLMELNA
uniref:Copia protein n=1 Tax=Tanacetum cinerariifolium TaxID=118510 RepID=A0A6L2JWQ7_TANCI|nr:hypothetical protein [Tanacetum cinerariifolium]